MKLYRSLDTSGRKPLHRWTGTQADAKVAQTANGAFEHIEVPTSKPELLAWLNEREERVVFARAVAEMGSDVAAGLQDPPAAAKPEPASVEEDKHAAMAANGRCSGCGRTELGHHTLRLGDIQDAIIDAIRQLDQPWALKNIANGLRDRHAEITKEASNEEG